jgi:hypothetical protein
MTDQDFLHAFETTCLKEEDFDHAAHVRAGFLLIQRHGFVCALAHYCTALRALTAYYGAAEKYHETITIAYLSLINERMAPAPDIKWENFKAAHPDLFTKDALSAFYTPAQLARADYRAVFHLPRPGKTP